MAKVADYNSFWEIACVKAANGNDLVFHPCCDVWTTRNSKQARSSHPELIKWRQILHSLGKMDIDLKSALHAKMVEECWQIPVIINQHCRVTKTLEPALTNLPRHKHAKRTHDQTTPSNQGLGIVMLPSSTVDQDIHLPFPPLAERSLFRSDALSSVSFFIAEWVPSNEQEAKPKLQQQKIWMDECKEAMKQISDICVSSCLSVQHAIEKLEKENMRSKQELTKVDLERAIGPLNSLPSSNSDMLILLSMLVSTQTASTSR